MDTLVPKIKYGYVSFPFDNSPFSGGQRVRYVKEEGYVNLTRKDRIQAGDQFLNFAKCNQPVGWITIQPGDDMIGEKWVSSYVPMRRKSNG